MKKRFAVKTRFIFTGTFFINAGTKEEAREHVENHCGLVLGGNIHSSLPGEDADWDFPVHPCINVGKVTVKCNRRRV